MKKEIRFALKSKQRPKLAKEIGNILGAAPYYERVPSCAYDIAGYRLDKEGVLHIPEGEEFLAYYGERKLILRVAFERYLRNHPELRRLV